MPPDSHALPPDNLTAEHIEDIKLAASKMRRVERRAFQAAMAEKYCGANPRRAEALFGSSAKTNDFIVDSLEAWWQRLPAEERNACTRLQIKADNGPESNGQRTQFLHRMVQFADAIRTPIQLLYDPPYHSKYNPIERCWGILE
jgi:hypothetical protein